MALRFQKRIRVAPGVHLNLSKSGISTSFGPNGATVNVSKRGLNGTAGIPGSGLSYQKQLTGKVPSATATRVSANTYLAVGIIAAVTGLIVWLV